MSSPFAVVFAYASALSFTALVASSEFLWNHVLPHITHKLKLYYYTNKIEPIIFCVGLITFYSYVLIEFAADITVSLSRPNNYNARLVRLRNCHGQLQKLYPPFFVSSFLMYANTTRFDALRNNFVILQTILLLLQPIASMSSKPSRGLMCTFMYRSVLCWSILYAVFPRESNRLIFATRHFFKTFLDINNSYNRGYENAQWIL